jgi:hypothetical protein
MVNQVEVTYAGIPIPEAQMHGGTQIPLPVVTSVPSIWDQSARLLCEERAEALWLSVWHTG